MNLRCDQYFVEDDTWHQAEENFEKFLEKCENKKTVLFELGIGFNTPAIIRFPFEYLASRKENMILIRLNRDEAVVPESLGKQAIGINKDMQNSVKDIAIKVGMKNKIDKRVR